MRRLLLIDAYSIAFRAYFALPPLTDPEGKPIQAVYGCASMLLKLLEEWQPTHAVVALDASRVTFRHQQYAAYKAQRERMPDALSLQIPLLAELFTAFGLHQQILPGYEADDIIGTLASQWSEQIPVTILTGDRDLLQLVNEQVEVMLMRRGVSQVEPHSLATIREKYGLEPLQLIDAKGLSGDASDNLPGVPGIGEKTACKLLQRYGTLAEAIAAVRSAEVLSKKWEQNLLAHSEQATLCQQLATIMTQAPLPEASLDSFAWEMPYAQVRAFFQRFAFSSLLKRLPVEETEVGVVAEAEGEREKAEPAPYHAPTPSEWPEMEERWAAQQEPAAVVVDAAVGLGWTLGESTYCLTWEEAQGWRGLQGWLAEEKKPKWILGTKAAMVELARRGWSLAGVVCDAAQAAYLLDPTRDRYTFVSLAPEYGGALVEGEPGSLAALASQLVALRLLVPPLVAELRAQGLEDWLLRVEQPLLLVLAEMELHGMRIDAGILAHLQTKFQQRLTTIAAAVYEVAGFSFNLNSPKQLATLLFDKLGLPPTKRTKTGFSTNAEVLVKLAPLHPIVEQIIEYRLLGKLLSTYVEGLQRQATADGRVHTTFQTTVAATGRLSSTDPNLQNIPIRHAEGQEIRRAFIPSQPGWKLLAADYSQIELRILAHLTQDPGLLQAFQEAEDVHAQTAANVFGVPQSEVTSTMRRQAKVVNFGIIYGMGSHSLAEQLGISRKEASDFIARYFASYPGVKRYQEEVLARARIDGYVTTLLGRRRALPELTMGDRAKRSMAERMAINTPIQGFAADLIKQAMVSLHAWLRSSSCQAALLLQVHDELLLEAPVEELPLLTTHVRRIMTEIFPLSVPLCVSIAIGDNWHEAK